MTHQVTYVALTHKMRIQVIKQGDDGVGDHQAASQTSQSSTYDMGELRSEDEPKVKKRPAGNVDVRYPKRRAPNKWSSCSSWWKTSMFIIVMPISLVVMMCKFSVVWSMWHWSVSNQHQIIVTDLLFAAGHPSASRQDQVRIAFFKSLMNNNYSCCLRCHVYQGVMFTHEARVRQVQSYSASAAFSVSSRPVCVCSSSSMEQTMGTFVNRIWCLSIAWSA